ncbi:hypothetical protein [Shinella granuli]|uniref:hypothetical protein n=1 Tax=Shinella granuli TaxID=323621 RepID=UPI001055AB08|nr:hypothetical protein [Shinella granuli]
MQSKRHTAAFAVLDWRDSRKAVAAGGLAKHTALAVGIRFDFSGELVEKRRHFRHLLPPTR